MTTAVHGPEGLTQREREVLAAWIAEGSHKRVAAALSVSLQTIKNHITSILAKLDVQSIGQAAVIFDRWERGYQSWPDVERRRSGRDRRSGADRRGRGERLVAL